MLCRGDLLSCYILSPTGHPPKEKVRCKNSGRQLPR
nr:MAG TPA_asm: hypothetical protein [Caudoviricetes sp.]